MNAKERKELLLALRDFQNITENMRFCVVDSDTFFNSETLQLDGIQDYAELCVNLAQFRDNIIKDMRFDNDTNEATIYYTDNAFDLLVDTPDINEAINKIIEFNELIKNNECFIHTDTKNKAIKLMKYLDKKGYKWSAGQKTTEYAEFYNYKTRTYYALRNTKKTIQKGDIEWLGSTYVDYDNIIFENGGDNMQQEQELNKVLTDEEINEMFDTKLKDYFGSDYDDLTDEQKDILKEQNEDVWYAYWNYLNNYKHRLSNGDFETLYDLELVDTHYVKCDICGDIVDIDKTRQNVNDGNYDYVCDNCYDDGYTCDRCGYWCQDGETHLVNTSGGEEWWCDDCIENNAFYCNGYDEYYDSYDFSSYEVNGYNYCYEYCENNFYWCDECQNFVDGDDWDSDYDCCRWCAEDNHGCYYDRVASYHERPEQYLYGKVAKNVKSDYHHIGIELEIDKDNKDTERSLLIELANYYDTDNNELYFNHDGSLEYGFEIITQPHTYEAFKKMNWEKLLDACVRYGYKSHDTNTCGLHMHISRELLGATKDKQDRAISKLQIFIDANWDEIIKVSRRKGNELSRWANKTKGTTIAKQDFLNKQVVDDYKKIAKNKNATNRYYALNNTNYGTVEFRFMKGTLKYETFMACIDFLYRIAINSKNIKYKDILNNKLWLKGISENTKAYLKQRNAFLDAISE